MTVIMYIHTSSIHTPDSVPGSNDTPRPKGGVYVNLCEWIKESPPLQPNLARDLLRDAQKGVAPRAPLVALLRHDGRHAAVRVLAHPRVERDVAEKLDPEPFTLRQDAPFLLLPMAMAMGTVTMGEDLGLLPAMRTRKDRHVPHHPEHGHAHALEHAEPAHRVAQRDVLRCRHDHRAVYYDFLVDRQLDVACPRGQVEDEDVQRRGIAPGDGVEELV